MKPRRSQVNQVRRGLVSSCALQNPVASIQTAVILNLPSPNAPAVDKAPTMNPLPKVAIVTGAGSGIGRASALALLREGYAVVLAGRRPEALDATVKAAGSDGSRALAVAADLSGPAGVQELFAKTKD